MAEIKTTIDKLTENNWVFWKKTIHIYLLSKSLWQLVTGSLGAEATEANRRTFVERQFKALHIIVSSVSDSIQHLIPAEPDNPKDVWDALQAHFESRSAFNILTLNEQLQTPCTEKDDAVEWIKKRQETYLRLAAVGQNVDGTSQTMSTLSALPPSFAMLKTSLTTQVVTAGLSLENLLDHVKNFKKQSSGNSSDSICLSSQQQNQGTFGGASGSSKSKRGKYRGRGGFSCGGQRSGARDGRGGKSIDSIVCHECGGKGHFQRDCATFIRKNGGQTVNLHKEHSTTFAETERIGYLSEEERSNRRNRVVLDTAASSNMTFDGAQLADYKEFTKPSTVSFGDGSGHSILGVGKLHLKLTQNSDNCDKYFSVSDYYYVPSLSCHLLSVGSICAVSGRTAKFDNKYAVIRSSSGQVLLTGQVQNGVYVADAMVPRVNQACTSRGTGVLRHGASLNHAPYKSDFSSFNTVCTGCALPGGVSGDTVKTAVNGMGYEHCQPAGIGKLNTGFGENHSNSAAKVRAACSLECDKSTVFGERSILCNKSPDTAFQPSLSPFLDSKRNSYSTSGHCDASTHMLDRSGPPSVGLSKGRATGQPLNESAFLSTSLSADLWHPQFGHVGAANMRKLMSNNYVTDMKFSDTKLPFCSDCAHGKGSVLPFPAESMHRSKRLLGILHSNICGPFPVNSSYENESGQKLGILRSDRGGEYMSNRMSNFLKKRGVKRQLAVADAHQQNGVAERMNRTIMDRVRSMLSESGLPHKAWAEAVNWAVYVRNRCPTSSLPLNVTPFQAWYGFKPSVSHFRVFRCAAYAHVPLKQRSKLDPKTED